MSDKQLKSALHELEKARKLVQEKKTYCSCGDKSVSALEYKVNTYGFAIGYTVGVLQRVLDAVSDELAE